ncbi:hypothetical protein QQ045_010271 [Rhodiola kirilowii]
MAELDVGFAVFDLDEVIDGSEGYEDDLIFYTEPPAFGESSVFEVTDMVIDSPDGHDDDSMTNNEPPASAEALLDIPDKVIDSIDGHDDESMTNNEPPASAEAVLDIPEKVIDSSDGHDDDQAIEIEPPASAEEVLDIPEKVIDSMDGHDDDQAIENESVVTVEAEEQVEKEVVKPSFIDILKSNPNLGFEEKKKTGSDAVVRKTKSGTAMDPFGSDKPVDQDVKPVVRSAEKRVSEASQAKNSIQRKVENKEDACKEAKRVYEAAVSDLKAMRSLLKATNVKISEAQSVLKRLRRSGDVDAVLGEEPGLKTVFLADGIRAIVDALGSSGVGIHDLDWTELADEILKPFKKEAVLLKEDIRKAEGFTKASKKNHDNRTEELKVLKAQLKEAESNFREAERELMMINPKELTEKKEDLKADEGDNNEAKVASKRYFIGQICVGYKDIESCKEDAVSNLMKAVEKEDRCFEYKCIPDQTSGPVDGCGSEKTIENEDSSTEETVESEDMWNTDHTSEPEDGYKSEQAMVSEKEWNNKELDDAGDGELAEKNTWEEEADKIELSEIEVAEEETANNDLPTQPQLQKKCNTSKNKVKKQKKRARKARAKAAGQLNAQEGDEEDEALTLRDGPCKMVAEMPYQVYLALAVLTFLGVMLWLRNEDELENILPLPDEIPDVFDDDKSSSDGGDGKLTRAQRKRLRKRKLKEESARRGKMVGPLLPATDEENDHEGVRRNVSLNPNLRIETDESGGVESCSANSKVKQRRIARKLAKPMPECDNSEKLNGRK